MNILFGVSACWRTHACAVMLGLCALATVASAAPPTLQQRRSAFRTAYAAAQAGKPWRALATGLQAYPLYPYLEGAALEHGIGTAKPAAIDAYLQRYPGLIPARDLRRAELSKLAGQQDWTTFEHFYRPNLGTALTCDALQARLARGGRLDFARDLAPLWHEANLPSACHPVLEAAFAQGLLTPARVWDRIERAADAGHSRTVERAARWLTATAATGAKRIAVALASPAHLLQQASSFTDTPRNREAVARALQRLARHASTRAIAAWPALSRRFTFDAVQRGHILAALALYNAVDGGPDAVPRLAKLPAAAQTDATRAWRVRAAVAAGDWKAAWAAIAALTPAEMQHDEWRYWKSRIAQQVGDSTLALDGYTALARQATFYGFLAADRASVPYSICPATIAPNPVIDARVQSAPGLQRAFEFFALDMLPQARREWAQAYADLDPAQQRQAAVLASRRGWYSRAVFAFGKLDEHAYAFRFPLADKTRVVKASGNAGIDPAWAFAIIRAESAWEPDAHSGAGARGLMQLLPSTAAMVARRHGLVYHGRASLYDPAVNIPLGTRYLAHLAAGFDGSPWLASAAYNAGPGNVRRWLARRGNLSPERFILTIPFNATRAYVTRVLSFATLYDWRLHGSARPVSTRLPAIGSDYDPATDPARKPVVCRAPAPSPAPRGSASP